MLTGEPATHALSVPSKTAKLFFPSYSDGAPLLELPSVGRETTPFHQNSRGMVGIRRKGSDATAASHLADGLI